MGGGGGPRDAQLLRDPMSGGGIPPGARTPPPIYSLSCLPRTPTLPPLQPSAVRGTWGDGAQRPEA